MANKERTVEQERWNLVRG